MAYISPSHTLCDKRFILLVTNILSRVHGRKIKHLIEEEYKQNEEEEQSRIRAGRTYTNNVFCLKQLTEKNVNTNQENSSDT